MAALNCNVCFPSLPQAALKQLARNKVPNMAVLLKSIIHTHADAKAVFKDPTGSRRTHTVTPQCWRKHFKLQRNGVK